jgi:uncharacterized protein
MLIEFSVENYRSFREQVTLSMIAAKLRARDEQLDQDNVITVSDKLSLVRSVAIYGANASGKSNLIKAFAMMRDFVRNSARGQAEDAIPVEPFLLDKETTHQPSTFEIVFLLDNIQYRYGFSATPERVLLEWLYYVPKSHEVKLFTREDAILDLGTQFREGRRLAEKTRKNALFLSVVAQFNGEISEKVVHYIRSHYFISENKDSYNVSETTKYLKDDAYHNQIKNIIKTLDLDIEDIQYEEPGIAIYARDAPKREDTPISPLNLKFKQVGSLVSVHQFTLPSGELREVRMPFQEMESLGTQKVLALSGPLLNILTNGYTLFLDEMDARLHPLITQTLLSLFHSPDTNPNNAQLIFVTHDTNLLDKRLLRRDQIYFTEKDKTSGTKLYSLAEFKLESKNGKRTIRNDSSYDDNYKRGRYGAIPYLGDVKSLFRKFMVEKQTISVGEDA